MNNFSDPTLLLRPIPASIVCHTNVFPAAFYSLKVSNSKKIRDNNGYSEVRKLSAEGNCHNFIVRKRKKIRMEQKNKSQLEIIVKNKKPKEKGTHFFIA